MRESTEFRGRNVVSVEKWPENFDFQTKTYVDWKRRRNAGLQHKPGAVALLCGAATKAKFGLHAGNIKFSTKSKE